MKRAIFVVFATLMALMLPTTAFASSVHLKGGARAEPAFTDGGIFLSAEGALAGLGGGDVLVSLEAEGNVTSTCTNQGGNAAPGQNPAPLTFTGEQPISEEEIKNGTTPFNVATEAPETPIPGAPGCANSNWTETIDDVAFINATITVEQPVGTLVLTVSCTFNSPTADGPVPGANVSCTQS